jgi:hypothetical protein
MSIHAADAITAELTGAAQRPLQFRYVAQNLSIGRRDGVIQILNRDDTPRRTILAGRVAAGLKERVVRATISAARHPLIDGGPRRRRPLYPTAVESRTGINTDSSYNR